MTYKIREFLNGEVLIGEIRFRKKPINIDGAKWTEAYHTSRRDVANLKVRVACCGDWWELIDVTLQIYPVEFHCALCQKQVIVHAPVGVDILFHRQEPKPEIEDAIIGVIRWVEKENINEHILL